MADHPIQDLMKTAMDSIKNMVDANTIIGDTITAPDGTIIIPISKVTFGFAAGGSDYAPSKETTQPSGQDTPFGGGSGAGITVKPIGFLICSPASGVRFLTVDNSTASSDKLLDMIPWVFEKINNYLNKKDDECDENDPFEKVNLDD